MLVNRIVTGLFLVLTIISCTQSLAPKEYVDWVKDYNHGLHRKRTIGDFTIDALYKPLDFALLEQNGVVLKNPNEITEKRAEMAGMIYFDLELSNKNSDVIESVISTEEELPKAMYYFSFDFQKDITLTTNSDTSNCELYHFLRTYKVGNTRKFLLGFPKKKSFDNSDFTLNIDSEVLGVGNVKIKYEIKDINNLPILKK